MLVRSLLRRVDRKKTSPKLLKLTTRAFGWGRAPTSTASILCYSENHFSPSWCSEKQAVLVLRSLRRKWSSTIWTMYNVGLDSLCSPRRTEKSKNRNAWAESRADFLWYMIREAMAIILRFIDKDWIIQHRLIDLQLLAKSTGGNCT